MSREQRFGLVAATLVALAIALFLLSPGGSKDGTVSTNTTAALPATPAGTGTTGGGETTTTTPAAAQGSQPTVIRVRGGKPIGGVRAIKVTSGELVRIEVRSADTADEVHLHGYDIKRDLEAGGRALFAFKADAEGIFVMELEGTGTPIAKIVVEPG